MREGAGKNYPASLLATVVIGIILIKSGATRPPPSWPTSRNTLATFPRSFVRCQVRVTAPTHAARGTC